ncbi:MAG TPA: NusG domain II-containing protein [Actinobacteria bacterium]|mgnify:CR=1 FL=1|nr:NusG domain II-containing protein [Actinomycetota bacterium]
MLTRYDKAFIGSLLFVALVILIGGAGMLNFSMKKGEEVVVLVNGQEVERCRLDYEHPKRMEIEGPFGESIIEVANGKVRMVSSPCPNHNCVARGWISAPGDMIVCVPNQVVVKIIGCEAKNKVDVFNG